MDRYKKVKVIGKGAFGAAVLVQARSDPKQQYVIKQASARGFRARCAHIADRRAWRPTHASSRARPLALGT